MAKSDYIFESGEAIDVGSHGETDYVFASGEPVANSGDSSFVFESGTGLGGLSGITVVFRDSNGETTGSIGTYSAPYDPSTWYYDQNGKGTLQEIGSDTWIIYEDTSVSPSQYSILCQYSTGNSEEADHSGIPDGGSFVMKDDLGTDYYSISPPTARTEPQYGDSNGDGFAIGSWSSISTTYLWDITAFPDYENDPVMRAVDDEGNEIRRNVPNDDSVEVELQIGL